jgi:hypothetical protein
MSVPPITFHYIARPVNDDGTESQDAIVGDANHEMLSSFRRWWKKRAEVGRRYAIYRQSGSFEPVYVTTWTR